MNSISYLADPAGDHRDASSLLIRRGQLVRSNDGTLAEMGMIEHLGTASVNCFEIQILPDNWTRRHITAKSSIGSLIVEQF